MGLKLYRISQAVNTEYDTYDSAVVVAENEEDARRIHPDGTGAKWSGEDPLMRIALCGYEGEHEFPASWKAVAWKTVGGYGNQGTGQVRDNSARERVWFSPHCLFSETLPLFDVEEVS